MESGEVTLDLGIAVSNQTREMIEGLDRLLEGEEMLIAPGAGEGFGDVVLGGFTVDIAMLSQLDTIAFTAQDVADDGETSNTGDVLVRNADIRRKLNRLGVRGEGEAKFGGFALEM
jgi:hypothetical protein